MINLSLDQYGEIRVTPDARFSVFDVVEVIGGKKNPRDAWKALTESFPEVVGKTDSFKFPGKGQQLTPVTDTEGLLYIIGLLPGAVGHSYREEAAKLMLAKIKGNKSSDNRPQLQPQAASPLLLPTPKEIAEAIESVLNIAGIDPMLIAGVAANEIGNTYPALKPNMEAAKKLLPVPVEEELLTVTELAKQYIERTGMQLSKNNTERGNAIGLNKLLLDLGLQIKNIDDQPSYLPTESGKQYSKVVLQEGKNSNKTCQQLRWYKRVLEVI